MPQAPRDKKLVLDKNNSAAPKRTMMSLQSVLNAGVGFALNKPLISGNTNNDMKQNSSIKNLSQSTFLDHKYRSSISTGAERKAKRTLMAAQLCQQRKLLNTDN